MIHIWRCRKTLLFNKIFDLENRFRQKMQKMKSYMQSLGLTQSPCLQSLHSAENLKQFYNIRYNQRPLVQACRKWGAGGGGARALPVFAGSVNPTSPGGGHIMPTTLLRATPDFQTLRRPWNGFGALINFVGLFTFHRPNESVYTPPVLEISCVKNVRAIVICGFCKRNILKK
jgi:hypothetical protein